MARVTGAIRGNGRRYAGIVAVAAAVAVPLLGGCDAPDQPGSAAGDVASEASPILAGEVVDPNSSSAPAWTKRIIDFGGCVGTLIDPDQQWVLTAAHCIPPKYQRNVSHHPTGAFQRTSHLFVHPTLDVGLARIVTPIATHYSGALPLYTGSASSLVGKTVDAYGYGWRAVDWSFGRNCDVDSDCASGYTCSASWHWCKKEDSTVNGSPVLRRASFPIDSLADSSTRYVMRQNPSKQLPVPGDSGGPDALSDGTITGVGSTAAYSLAYAKSVAAPAFRDWVATRMACPLFDVTHFNSSLCTPDCPCDIGQGDCDSDDDCLPGLACRQYGTNRQAHGFPANYDICVDPACPVFDPLHASDGACIYSGGEGDCDTDDDCGGTLICRNNIGGTVAIGANPILDLCVEQPAPGCTTDVCSSACPCELGEGSCTSNADCRRGLMCGRDMGAAAGRPATDDICVAPEAIACSSDDDCPGASCVWGACRWIAPVVVNPSSECGVFRANQGMYPNQPLFSCDGRFRLYLQGDSNLVLSQKDSHGDFSVALWTTGNATIGKDGYTFIVGDDGNLVLYDSVRVPIWATGTQGQPTYLHLKDDGNLILFATQRDASGHLPQLWRTDTGGH